MNEFWDSSENHTYDRTNPFQQSVDIADRIISHDETFGIDRCDYKIINGLE